MHSVRTTRQLIDDGYSEAEIRRQVSRGEMDRLRRGGLRQSPPPGGDRYAEATLRHRQLIEATVPLCGAGSVVSHRSAAVVWGLPVDVLPSRVDVTRNSATSGQNRGWVHLRVARMEPAEVTVVDGIAVTTLARTVVDLARTLPLPQSVVTGDAALARGLDRQELGDCLDLAKGRPGIGPARRACAFFDGRSESGGESISRARLAMAGIPAPELQYDLVTPGGEFVARLDFFWRQFRTAGECDGMGKYDQLAGPNRTTRDVLVAEKRRETAIRRLGIEVVRWGVRDLDPIGALVGELQDAFARGRRR